uniref:Uncharacterized protein n=1 Tax=Romanomermis culicivorax TaxID=13658 RepID=A0A915IR88_ROMCU
MVPQDRVCLPPLILDGDAKVLQKMTIKNLIYRHLLTACYSYYKQLEILHLFDVEPRSRPKWTLLEKDDGYQLVLLPSQKVVAFYSSQEATKILPLIAVAAQQLGLNSSTDAENCVKKSNRRVRSTLPPPASNGSTEDHRFTDKYQNGGPIRNSYPGHGFYSFNKNFYFCEKMRKILQSANCRSTQSSSMASSICGDSRRNSVSILGSWSPRRTSVVSVDQNFYAGRNVSNAHTFRSHINDKKCNSADPKAPFFPVIFRRSLSPTYSHVYTFCTKDRKRKIARIRQEHKEQRKLEADIFKYSQSDFAKPTTFELPPFTLKPCSVRVQDLISVRQKLVGGVGDKRKSSKSLQLRRRRRRSLQNTNSPISGSTTLSSDFSSDNSLKKAIRLGRSRSGALSGRTTLKRESQAAISRCLCCDRETKVLRDIFIRDVHIIEQTLEKKFGRLTEKEILRLPHFLEKFQNLQNLLVLHVGTPNQHYLSHFASIETLNFAKIRRRYGVQVVS